MRRLIAISLFLAALCSPELFAAEQHAPDWMHALASVPLPPHTAKTNAVQLLYSETVSVISENKFIRQVRVAYRILRPSGRDYGQLYTTFTPRHKITSLRGWSIPADGKDFEVTEKDAIQANPVPDWVLFSDISAKVFDIPAANPGAIVGFEYFVEENPLDLQDEWTVQDDRNVERQICPAVQRRYTLLLPPGWTFKPSWFNHAAIEPTRLDANTYEWSVKNVPGIEFQPEMPPLQAVQGLMVVSLIPPSSSTSASFTDWKQMGDWYTGILRGRNNPSPDIRQKVAEITDGKKSSLEQMTVIADFVQREIRYVAIELGIGGYQPHPAPEVFTHRYGDCKDKATLMSAMLSVLGIDSYHLVIHTEPGAVTSEMPAHHAFDHAILAVRLPQEAVLPAIAPVYKHPGLGRLLIFDPTNEYVPFGQIPGYEQGNWALLVTPDGGELIQVPQPPPAANRIERTGKFTLDASGTLEGSIDELRVGEPASQRRGILLRAKTADRVKPFEQLLSDSLTFFHITRASVSNLEEKRLPLGMHYSFLADQYARPASGMLLIRPRILGRKSSSILEDKEQRRFPVLLGEVHRDSDVFEIALPAGYEVDELPPPADADYSFASYHAKCEFIAASGPQPAHLLYTRSLEIKEPSVQLSRMAELRSFYRLVASDESNQVILKRAAVSPSPSHTATAP